MDFEIVLCSDSNHGIGVINTDIDLDSNSSEANFLSNTSTIPWKISEDMKFFRDLTRNVPQKDFVEPTFEQLKLEINSNIDTNIAENTNVHIPTDKNLINAIIMGRKTADTFKKPLPDRINVVITSQAVYRPGLKGFKDLPGFVTFKHFDDALNFLAKRDDVHKVFVIGGAILADVAIHHPRCRNVYLNTIAHDYNCGVKPSDNFITKLKTSYVETSNNTEIVQCKNIGFPVIIEFKKYTFMNHEELAYLNMLDRIIKEGDYRMTRNAKTFSVFGERLIFDLDNGFPLLTTKRMFYRGIFEELLFFIRGETDTKLLENKKVMIWHLNTTEEFMIKNNKSLEKYDMGPMYGFLWRHYGAEYKGCHHNYDGQGIDQLQNVIDLLTVDPNSRRILMTTYDVKCVDTGVLYPCHGLILQFYIEKNNRISLQMYMRSVDFFLGNPFNIASYALLLKIVTELVNNHIYRTHDIDYTPGRVIMIFGDAHVYSDEKDDHVLAVLEQLKRKDNTYPFPIIRFKKNFKTIKDVENMSASDIEVVNYISGSTIKALMYE